MLFSFCQHFLSPPSLEHPSSTARLSVIPPLTVLLRYFKTVTSKQPSEVGNFISIFRGGNGNIQIYINQGLVRKINTTPGISNRGSVSWKMVYKGDGKVERALRREPRNQQKQGMYFLPTQGLRTKGRKPRTRAILELCGAAISGRC